MKIHKPLLALLLTASAAIAIAQGPLSSLLGENEFLKKLRETFASFMETHPEDRVYLHFDKPFYKPGETIWFQAYVRGADMKPSTKSGIVNIEFISPKGTKSEEYSLVLEKGVASGEIALDESMAGGMYKVRAFTNWQLNYDAEGNDGIFEKDIQIQTVVLPRLKMKLDFERKSYDKGETATADLKLESLQNEALANHTFTYVASLGGNAFKTGSLTTDAEGKAKVPVQLPAKIDTEDGLLNVMIPYNGQTESISRSIPLAFKEIHLDLFPEGGDMVSGLPTRVAFRARKKDMEGKPADIQGKLMDANGKQIVSFSSHHDGMGAFQFTPEKGKKYHVELTSPKGVEKTFPLPEALPAGYSLALDDLPRKSLILAVNSTEKEELSLIAQMQGKVYWTEVIKVNGKGQAQKINVPIDDLPMGVLQVTLFDSRGIERAERLAFIHRDRTLDIDIKTDKPNYQPREKVKLTITAKDSRGIPMPAQLSISVTDDKIVSFADDKQGNIISKLLLEPELNTKVHEPNFYFDQSEVRSLAALDYLMMTSGWRRFTWEQVRENNLPIQFEAESNTLYGTVRRKDSKSVEGTEISISGGEFLDPTAPRKITLGADGSYEIKGIVLTSPVTLEAVKGELTASAYITQYGNYDLSLAERILYDEVWMEDAPQEDAAVVMMAPPQPAMARAKGQKAPRAAKEAEALPPPPPVIQQPEIIEVPDEEEILEEIEIDLDLEVDEGEIEKDGFFQFDDKVDEKKRARGDFFLEQGPRAAQPNQSTQYRRGREFPAPDYAQDQKPATRTDFRETIFWKGNVEIDRKGKAEVEFYNSDAVTAFRVTVEGIGGDGTVGHQEITYFTLLPFSTDIKVPVEVTMGDQISIPLTLTNNTADQLTVDIDYDMPSAFSRMSRFPSSQIINPKQTSTIYLKVKVANQPGKDTVRLRFVPRGTASEIADAFEQPVFIGQKGFPVDLAISSQQLSHQQSFEITKPVDGTISAQFTAYPTVLSDMLSGIESILREPYGCFEQTSSSTYPNILVMSYLQTIEENRPEVREKALALIDKGYQKLTSFETKEKGYEWFGAAPAHEALTAYGLMEFKDMAKVFDQVDPAMIDRTAEYILDRKDGKGGFQRNDRALDSYGRASKEITDAYIVYALSEAGYHSAIKAELDKALQTAKEQSDPYQSGLVANALLNSKDPRANALLQSLVAQQQADGSWIGKTHSITYSQGQALTIETTSLALMAMLKTSRFKAEIKKAADFLINARSPHGGFGNTQSTVMALRALTAFAQWAKQAPSSGDIQIYVNDKRAAEYHFDQGQQGEIVIAGLEKQMQEGKNTIRIQFKNTKEALPYTTRISYSTLQPISSDSCRLSLNTQLSEKNIQMGQTVRMNIALKNITDQGQPMTMAVVGIPGGLSAQPWQLKELQEKKVFDFYEIKGNTLALYYRQMKPSESKNIALDLKADIPGTYEAPASRAYLYYTSEYKDWQTGTRIEITE